MRIGIVTYWNTADNYGTVLQYYAIQKYLRSLGHEPFLIRYTPAPDRLRKRISIAWKSGGVIYLFRQTCRFLVHHMSIISQFSRQKGEAMRNFDEFRKRHFSMSDVYHSYSQLKQNPPEADMLIAGSDQIWNIRNVPADSVKSYMQTVFLDFGNAGVKRASCAASFGGFFPNSLCAKEIEVLLRQFDFVSVRERHGLELLGKMGIHTAYLQRDPTFLLPAEAYRDLSTNITSPATAGKYILLYLLNNTTDFSVGKLSRWASKQGLHLVYVSANELYYNPHIYKKTYATIPQFLHLLDGAEYVFTNSFHGTVFSVIFQKQFLYVEQKDRFQAQNQRVHEILEWLSLESRIFSMDFHSVQTPIDYDSILPLIAKNRQESPFVTFMNEFSNSPSGAKNM